METLRHRLSNQKGRRGSSTGLFLPSLYNNKHWDYEEPALWSGNGYRPVPPRKSRQRTGAVVNAPQPLHGLMSVPGSIQLSQSTPTIMEPLLCSSTQIGLGSQKFAPQQKGLLPAWNTRAPKRLAPLHGHSKDSSVLSVLKPKVPLKPISRSSFCSRQNRERLSWGSHSHSSPITCRTGSEESRSTSSQSSIDLEDDDNDTNIRTNSYSDRNYKSSKDVPLPNPTKLNSTAIDQKRDARLHFKAQNPLVYGSTHHREGKVIQRTSHYQSSERMTNSDREANIVSYTRDSAEGDSSKRNKKSPTTSFTTNEINHKVNFTTKGRWICDRKNACPERHPWSKKEQAKQTEKTRNTAFGYKTKMEKITSGDTKSLNEASHQDQNNYNEPKSHIDSTLAKNKERKNSELRRSQKTAGAKDELKMKSVSTTAFISAAPTPCKKVCDLPQSSGAPHLDKHCSSRSHHSAGRKLKSVCLEASTDRKTLKSQSAVDRDTYKDLLQQIQSADKQPVDHEIFVGPVQGNLKELMLSSPRKSLPSHNVKHRSLRLAQRSTKKILGERGVGILKSKMRYVPLRIKPAVKTLPKEESREQSHKVRSVFVSSKNPSNNYESAQDEKKKPSLSTPEEASSSSGSKTVKSHNTPLKPPGTCPEDKNDPNQCQTNVNTPGENSIQQVPELVALPDLLQSKIKTMSTTSSYLSASPIFQKFLDDLEEDGPLTDDLLQCLAEELISLDETDVSEEQEHDVKGLSSEDEPSRQRQNGFLEALPKDQTGSELVLEGTITWTKGDILGRGAYGTVYCGLTSQGQLIAVKQVSLDSSNPDAARKEYQRLQGEVNMLRTLQHINIVGFLGTLLKQHVVSIFMEYIPGGSIASIIHRFGPLPERVLTLYTQQILEGVAFLHLNGVIHRDLKGNNVMLMPTGIIKLIDFGSACRLSCLNQTASMSGDLRKSVHGTPYWMAPEIINQSGYGRKSDIWSIGCTVFEMATGKPPLAHMDKMAALFYIGAQRGLMPSLPDEFSESARDFVRICFTSDQRLRPSADQLLQHSFLSWEETCKKKQDRTNFDPTKNLYPRY